MDKNLFRVSDRPVGQPIWLQEWPDNAESIIVAGGSVGIFAKKTTNDKYVIETKQAGENSYIDLYLNEDDALENKNCYVRQYFSGNAKEIPLESIRNPELEVIYGDWQSRNFYSKVCLYYKNGKLEDLDKGEYKVKYLTERNKINKANMFSHLPNSVVIDGKSGIVKSIGGDPYTVVHVNNLLQEKIFDKQRNTNATKQFAAVLRGIENEDVTTYVCNYFRSPGINNLEENGVYLRFPHSADGYWEDYFLKLNEEKFRTLEGGTVLSKQEKFIYDLGLDKKENGFAIVPFKYNNHFVSLVIDCSTRSINLFDSSLYSIKGSDQDNDEEIEKGEAFRDFLLGNPEILNDAKIEECDILLNNLTEQGSLQGISLEDDQGNMMIGPDNSDSNCYNMGTCGFWTIAFCIEAAKCKNFQELKEKCKNGELIIKTAKRLSTIIDGQNLINELNLDNYKIPKNSVCIPSYLKLNNGEKIGYCDNLRQMLIEFGPSINTGTGKNSSTIKSKYKINNNIFCDYNVPHVLKKSKSQMQIKQQILKFNKYLKPKTKENEDIENSYWRNKINKKDRQLGSSEMELQL